MPPVIHPRRDERNRQVRIEKPTPPTGPETWSDPSAIAVFVPGGACPAELNGVPMMEAGLPSAAAMQALAGSVAEDPPLPAMRPLLRRSAGAVIQEPDGRVWVFEPTNHFGGTVATFPKGRLEPGDSPREAAVREVWEETGLLIALGGWLGDVERSTSMVRYFLARRVGGCPAAMGWEGQALWLTPLGRLSKVMRGVNEAPLVAIVEKKYQSDLS